MFDFVRNLTKSAEEKQQELLAAYIDDALPATERRQFEAQLAQNEALAAQVRQQQLIKQRLNAMPRRRVPRSFALDPAVYGKPTPKPLFQFYPVLQTATVLAALVLMFLVGLEQFGGAAQPAASEAPVAMVEESAETAVMSAAEEAAPAGAEMAVAEDSVANSAAADEAAPEEPAQGFAAPAAEGEAVPTVASIPRADEAAEEMRAASAETAVSAEEQLAQSTEAYAATVEAPVSEVEQTAVEPTQSPLRGLQIGLALTFVILLILTLLVRQRVR
ncbi:MAG: zf-HC2 domain-containing protein [Anaerolineales bacterium]|nr:zf-HC2 domain-containing protein [Anaerolineales bacterium]